MKTSFKTTLSQVMNLAWQFVRRNGYTLSEALKTAWANIKLRKALATGIVRFYFQKVDGTLREAFGTLKSDLVPPVAHERRNEVTCQTYYDTEKQAWRCFKKANLVKISL